jgi:hypothetical protein
MKHKTREDLVYEEGVEERFRVAEDKIAEAAAFLDVQAGRIDSCAVTGDGTHPHLVQIAADCRAMAKKLRGEPDFELPGPSDPQRNPCTGR